MLGPANPFETLASVPLDGRGPNPLLQNHMLMAFHPPMLYLGYVGFTVPFMFAIGALVTGRFGEGWLADTRRATLVAWGFLTVGIILGAWWSYEVLGWGGFWAWDPVENASLLPWLTGTAFIHSVIVQERRGMLRVWNLSLVIATFCLTILGTFLTRSGVLDSVHAFTESDIGPWLLTFLGITAATGIGLLAWRGDALRAPGRIDSAGLARVGVPRQQPPLRGARVRRAARHRVPAGRRGGARQPAVGGRAVLRPNDHADRPRAPVPHGRRAGVAVAGDERRGACAGGLLVPAWIGGLTMLVAVVLGARGVWEVLAYGLGAFATAGIVRQFVLGVQGRRRALGESGPRALGRATRSNPRLYGGLVVHLGVVLIAVALAASSAYSHQHRGAAPPWSSRRPSPGTRSRTSARTTDRVGAEDHDLRARCASSVVTATSACTRPRSRRIPNSTEGIGTPSVRTGLKEDVYLTLVSSPSAGSRVTLVGARQPDDPLALDRRGRDGARHDPRPRPAPRRRRVPAATQWPIAIPRPRTRARTARELPADELEEVPA